MYNFCNFQCVNLRTSTTHSSLSISNIVYKFEFLSIISKEAVSLRTYLCLYQLPKIIRMEFRNFHLHQFCIIEESPFRLFITLISGFRCEADKNCSLLSYCAASSGSSILTFPDNLSVSYSTVENQRRIYWIIDP